MSLGSCAEFSSRGVGGRSEIGNGDNLVGLLEFGEVGSGHFGNGR